MARWRLKIAVSEVRFFLRAPRFFKHLAKNSPYNLSTAPQNYRTDRSAEIRQIS